MLRFFLVGKQKARWDPKQLQLLVQFRQNVAFLKAYCQTCLTKEVWRVQPYGMISMLIRHDIVNFLYVSGC